MWGSGGGRHVFAYTDPDLTSFLLARSASGTTCEPRGFYLSGGLAVVTLLRAKLCLGLYSSSVSCSIPKSFLSSLPATYH
eukprot:g36219.t1